MSEFITAPKKPSKSLQLGSVSLTVPRLITDEGRSATKRFIEYFTAHIRNANTREAYGRAVRDFFAWCDDNRIGPLIDIEAVHIAAYIEQMTQEKAPQTVKQRLAAINAYTSEACHPFHVNAATRTRAKLPPNRSVATQGF